MPTDNEKLELVFLKLGLAETDDELQTIVNNYLVPVLLLLATNEEFVRNKVLELLAHLNKRLKARDSIKLPVKKLLDQLNSPSTCSFTKNFSLTYINIGFSRLMPDERKELVPALFTSIKEKPRTQQDLILRLVVENLSLVNVGLPEHLEKLFNFSDNPEASDLFLEFCLDFLLLPYSISKTGEGSLTCPPGLSLHAMKKLLPDTFITEEMIYNLESVKVAILNILKCGVFPPNEIMCHLVVASADTRHTVGSMADVEFRRLLSSVNWDSVPLNLNLYKLYLGQAGIHSKKPVEASKKREPADIRMKIKLISALSRSNVAGACFPQSVQVVYDGLFGKTNAKLQLLTLQFVYAITDRSKESNIQHKQAPLLFEALVKVTKNNEMSEDCLAMAFVALGKLLKRFPKLVLTNFGFIQSLFDSLEKISSQKIKDSIQETLVLLSVVFRDVTIEDQFMMEKLVESSIASSDDRLQFVGVHYATTVFSSTHVPSKYQLLLALSQTQENASNQAHKHLFASTSDEQSQTDNSLPSFTSMVNYVYEKAEERVVQRRQFSLGRSLIVFAPTTFQAIIVYLRRCLLGNPFAEISTDASNLDSTTVVKQVRDLLTDDSDSFMLIKKYFDLCFQYLSVVADAFVMLLMLEVVASAPESILFDELFLCPSKHLQGEADSRILWLKKQLNHTNENVRCFAAEAYSIVVRQKFNVNGDYLKMFEDLSHQIQSKNYETRHGSIVLLGFVIGDWLKIMKEKNETNEEAQFLAAKLSNALVKVILDKRDLNLSIASSKSVGEIARKSPLPLENGCFPDDNEEMMEVDFFTKADVVKRIASCIDKNTSHQFRESLVLTLGRLPVGDSQFPFTEKIIFALLQTAEVKDVELHFSVGAALCSAALGVNSPERYGKWETKDQHLIATGKDSLDWLLDEILNKYVGHRIPAVRQASAIWLMVMMKTKECIERPAVQSHLIDLHNAFQLLLTEADDLTQDIASKGFGIVYNLADTELKKTLVDQLVDSLTGNKKTPAKIRVLDQDGANLIPGSSIQLGKAPDGSNLSTYKELCSLASDLNQPDLVYKFMQLANHHSQWNSKKGAAFGFRSIIEIAREELAPHLPKIVPRLYRYTFDPHPPIRAAMTSIWNVLAPSPQKTIHEYLHPIMDDLLHNLTSSVWRSREASCLALNNLLQTAVAHSSDAETRSRLLISKLTELWKTLIRVADDIKETVRKAAMDTCKRLQKVTIRLCDDAASDITKDGVLSEILSVLLNDGLTSKVDDVTKLSLSCLVEISKLHNTAVKPCLPQMIGKLLEALSGMEDPTINYIHTRSSSGGQSAVDAIRVQAVKSHPLMETASRCVEQCDGEVIKDVVFTLVDLVKRAVGTLTKAGCSYAVRILATTCRNELEPFCGKLMNAFLSALRDRSPVIRKLHAQTIGYLAPFAADDALEKIVLKMKQWYLKKEEDSLHHGSAVVLQAIAQKSPDVLSRHAALVLPLAFYGMHENGDKKLSEKANSSSLIDDKEMSVGDIWKSIWNEFTPGVASALHVYFSEILEVCSTNLQSSQWSTKIQAGLALSYMIEKQHTDAVVAPHLSSMLKALLESLRGRVWEGKHYLIKTVRDVAVHCASLTSEEQTNQILGILLNESKRGKIAYRSEAITALADTIHSSSIDRLELFWELAAPILQKSGDLSSDSDDEEDGVKKRKLKWDFEEKITATLPKPWKVASQESRERLADVMFTMLCNHVLTGSHSMQLVALSSLSDMLPSLPIPISTEKEVTVKKICQQIVPPLCICLGDMKYSSTREGALQVVKSLVEFITYVPDESVARLHETLKSSSLNTNTYHDYDLVVLLLNRLKSP